MDLSDTHRTIDGFVGGTFVIVELFSFELDRRKNIMFNKLNSTIYTFYEIKTSIPYIFRNENQIRPSTLIVINQATRYFMIHPVSIYLERIRKCSSPVLISSIYITIPFRREGNVIRLFRDTNPFFDHHSDPIVFSF